MKRIIPFLSRLLASLGIAFLLFPLGFALTHGPHKGLGDLLAGAVMMIFLQFISPHNLWVWPVLGGLLIAIGWQAANANKPNRPLG